MSQAVVLRKAHRVELAELEDQGVGPGEVAGDTLVTLMSPGTELAYFASDDLVASVDTEAKSTPLIPGYAAVFRVDELGADAGNATIDQLVYCMGSHRSRQCHRASAILPVPPGLDPAKAVFARLASVSMTTLVTTAARPPGPVLVLGLGLIGNLAAQVFQVAGYDVVGVDPIEARAVLARACGVRDARTSIEEQELPPPRLVVDCSGHEAAILQGCRIVQAGGEVVLVGVPWRQRSSISAHEVLNVVFHRYVHLRGGWEWELPLHDEPWRAGAIFTNTALALRWIHEGKLVVDGLAEDIKPEEAQHAYEQLLRQEGALTRCIRWAEDS